MNVHNNIGRNGNLRHMHFNNFFFPALRRHLAQFIPDFIHKFKNPAEVRLLLFHGFHNTIPKCRLHRFSHFFPAQ
ncbi:hypothetical protein I3843_08G003400 [Carya illinoinensis]|nr:hypothetical protein I3843_08G003400 [Carya illinoinensis]